MSAETKPKGEEENIVLTREYFLTEDGTEHYLFLTLFKRYRIWKAFDGRWRWALSQWKDDDFGLTSHGASRTLRGAVIAITNHRKLRKEVYG